MWNGTLPVISIKGTVRQGGEAYGEELEVPLMGFCLQTVKPDKARLGYAARCWRYIEKDAPISAEFMQGIAAGAHLPLEYITLLSLQEEIAHMPHCTAFVATGAATVGGETINGQNWDFTSQYHPWASLLKLQLQGTLDTLTYQYPGLWACAGINEAGLSLVWTTTAANPPVAPEVGVPTYVLVAEVLRRRTVEEAIRYIQSVKLAGAFNFLLGDAEGSVAVVEALPELVWVDQSSQAMSRANHYVGEELIRLSLQDVSGSLKDTQATAFRAGRMAQLVRQHYGNISTGVARAILTDRTGPWPWLHQYPEGEEGRDAGMMSLDSFYAVSQDRAFHLCRGGYRPGPWQEEAL